MTTARINPPLPPALALAWFLGVGILYGAVARLGLLFAGVGPDISVCWPGAGLALGLMILAPRRALPFIVAGIFVSNMLVSLEHRGLWLSAGFAAVNALEPLLAALLLSSRSAERFDLREPGDLLRFCLLASLSTALAAGASTLILCISGPCHLWQSFRTWWSADLLGVILVAPALIGWKDSGVWRQRPWWLPLEAAAMMATTLGLSVLTFTDLLEPRPAYLQLPAPVFPALLWAALRFGVLGTALASIVSSVIAVWGTRVGHGSFVGLADDDAERLTIAQSAFAIYGLAALTVAIAIRARAHRTALLRQERLNSDRAFDRSPVGMAIIATDGAFARVNHSLASLAGATPADLIGRPAAAVIKPCEDASVEDDLDALRTRTDVRHQRLVRLPRPAGPDAFALLHLTAVRDDHANLIHCFAQFVDVTRERRAEEDLRETTSRLALALGNAGHGLWDWDISTGDCFLDSGWESIHGYAPGEMPARVETWEASIHPNDRAPTLAAVNAHIADSRTPYDVDYRARRKDGVWIWINTRGRVVARDAQGRALRMMGTIHEITARKTTEERLRQSIRDKEVLLREIHHRVKNNLSAISGLLLLRSNQTDNPELRAAFTESRDRVRSIALVHDTLHLADNLDRIDLSAYLRSLSSQVAGTMAGGPTTITVTVRAEPITLGIDAAVPCGLIVNELLTNCYKHAFPGRESGSILVSAAARNGRCTISVRDDGIGCTIPEDDSKTLGLRLIKSLATQIGGEVSFLPADPGLEGRLTFSINSR